MGSRELKIMECVEFLQDNNILVLATQGEKGPHTSLMAYSCSEDGREVYMATSRDSRKWSNLKESPLVSLLIDDRDGKLTHKRNDIKALTVSGIFSEVDAQEETKLIMERIAGASPAIAALFSGPECSIIRIKVRDFLMLHGPEKAFFSGDIGQE